MVVRGHIFTPLVAIYFVLAACSAEPPANLHLSWQEDPATSATVSWQTSLTTKSIVQFGLDSSYGLKQEANPNVRTFGRAQRIYHNVHLTGLQPNTTYHFRCGDGRDWSQDHTFTTAPKDGPFAFLVVGDTLAELPNSKWPLVASLLAETEGGFVVHTGDLVLYGSDPEVWDEFFELEGKPAWLRPLMPCLGNHEENAQIYFDQFALPDAEQWYSFDYCNAHFISLSTETDLQGLQLEWLRDDLAASDATWKFVYFHKPPYCSTGGWEKVRKTWCALFDQYHVDIVFSGHIHVYERTKPIKNGSVQSSPSDGPIYIVTGGGGANLGSVTRQNWIVHGESVHHFLKLAINGSNLTCKAYHPNGSILDSFRIAKRIAPDLVVDPIQVTPRFPMPGEATEMVIPVRNRGNAPSDDFGVSVFIGNSRQYVLAFPGLGPAETVDAVLPWVPTREGGFNITVMVDHEDKVCEGAYEDNNQRTRSVLVSRPKPDLRILSVRMSGQGNAEGEGISFITLVENEGRADARDFDVTFSVSSSLFEDRKLVSLLRAGETVEVESSPWMVGRGSFQVVATVDREEAVDEYLEENQWSVCLHVLDFVQEGPVAYPRGPVEGEAVIVRYNATSGDLPANTSSCTIMWGVNGWESPYSDLWPPRSALTGPLLETPMEKGMDGLWYAAIPTDARTDRIDFKFRDQQMLGMNWDDNEGKGWSVGLRGWIEREIEALESAVSEVRGLGYNTTMYDGILAKAYRCMDGGVYAGCIDGLGNSTLVLGSLVIQHGIQLGWELVEDARAIGVDVDAACGLLERAEGQLAEGMILQARYSIETAVSMIEKRMQVEEGFLSFLLGGLAFLGSRLLQGGRAEPPLRECPVRWRRIGEGNLVGVR